MTSTLNATDVTKTYGTGDATIHALASISVRIDAGRSLAIMGPSGSGKTTLLHCLAGVVRPGRGQHPLARPGPRAGRRLRSHPATTYGLRLRLPVRAAVAELHAVENVALPLMLGGADRVTSTRLAG